MAKQGLYNNDDEINHMMTKEERSIETSQKMRSRTRGRQPIKPGPHGRTPSQLKS